MYVVTNRNIQLKQPAIKKFGSEFNQKAYDELRLARVKKQGQKWVVDILDEPATNKGRAKKPWPSEETFIELQKSMRAKKRNCVLYVHGYKVSFEDLLARAAFIEKHYKVEVVAFTWPSDGKLTRYRNDKRDAIRSVHALDRCFEKLSKYMNKYRDNACGQSFTLLLHSMGNYLFKHLLKSSVYEGETLLFENIVMASADVNHHDHVTWIDRVNFRKRLYITINESDYALGFSRAKLGSLQRTRLGHSTRNLSSRIADYIDFSGSKWMGTSHAYFAETKPLRNLNVKKVFHAILNGRLIEEANADVEYNAQTNAHIVR